MLDRNGIPVRGHITRVLPAATAFQTVRTAAKLDFDLSDVLTMVANGVTLSARFPKARSTLRDNPGHPARARLGST